MSFNLLVGKYADACTDLQAEPPDVGVADRNRAEDRPPRANIARETVTRRVHLAAQKVSELSNG
jgi:hypothetical protein